MAERRAKCLVLMAAALTAADLAFAANIASPGGSPRIPPMAIHRPGTPNVGSALVDAADRANDRDRSAEAEGLARQAQAVQERALGPVHPALLCRPDIEEIMCSPRPFRVEYEG